MNFFLLTLGCPKNQVDSDLLESFLRGAGWKIKENPGDADLILVNTCSFIVPAVEESIEAILELSSLKKRGTLMVVAGCLVSRYGKDTLGSLLPEVDVFISPDDYQRFPEILAGFLESGRRAAVHLPGRGFSSTLERGYVYIKITEGCHRRCSFCAIPRIRGPLTSRPRWEILEEARFFLEQGARELILVGQDTTSYGRERYGKGHLPFLLEELSALEGDFRIRLMYMHPDGVDESLLEAMEHPRVYPYFDLPLQHLDAGILRAMGRKGDPSSYRGLIERIRERFPEAAVRATFMVGFPGEDARSFQLLYRFAAEMRFDWLGLFGYSQEEGTPAYTLGPGCPRRVKRDRLQELSQLQEEIMRERALQLVGRNMRVLVEGRSDEAPGFWEARSYREAPEIDGVIFIPDGEGLKAGEWCEVSIESAEGIDLIAIPRICQVAGKDGGRGGG